MSENQPKISLVIIHYNTPHYLESCLTAIFEQTYKNIEVIFIDNNSPDKTGLEYVKKTFGHKTNLIIVPNSENLGYAKAANQGIRMAIEGKDQEEALLPDLSENVLANAPTNFEKADYVVITNPDIVYSPTYFEEAIARIEQDPKISALTGKVYKYDFERLQPTNIIDTVGLFAYKNRRIIDDGQGLIDEGQFDEECEVFGVSGACPLYRTKALEDVKIMGEYLDEDFFMYKEDVDLSWRFLLAGWKNFYYPGAVAYHGRGTGVQRRFFNKEIVANRKSLSKFQKKYSFKNQHLMERKNELWLNYFADFFPIIFKKLAVFAYITVNEPYLWASYFDYIKQLPRALKKRSLIMKKRRISAGEMRKWFKTQSKYLKG
ncbi:glycosyltransferase family 2 protein [Candidatus Gracilibacteria bacterium]|nr:glycosyltransferase family 2 protein [Candidatus Gracilibacteria bacterium]